MTSPSSSTASPRERGSWSSVRAGPPTAAYSPVSCARTSARTCPSQASDPDSAAAAGGGADRPWPGPAEAPGPGPELWEEPEPGEKEPGPGEGPDPVLRTGCGGSVTSPNSTPSRSASSGWCHPNRRATDSHRSSLRRTSSPPFPPRAPSATTRQGPGGSAGAVDPGSGAPSRSATRNCAADTRRAIPVSARRRRRWRATTEAMSVSSRIRSGGTGGRTTAQIEPSHSPPARTGMISRGSVPSGPAGARTGSLERASLRKTPLARKWAMTSGGTLRPTIVDTRAESVTSWRAE